MDAHHAQLHRSENLGIKLDYAIEALRYIAFHPEADREFAMSALENLGAKDAKYIVLESAKLCEFCAHPI